ncbi:hypothetical protein [Aliamphritea ceti]|uniref:hypothetical protein n=1 Tax=Aliamphritea ceti TaxID=1524258 RepID=UPI0021C45577|nr:hypothetical protein [Aliamphritea ceti]
MPTISSTRNDAPIKQDNSQGVTVKAASDSTDQNGITEALHSNPRGVELSTRAQKIQKLNEEFFSARPQSVSITPEFIARLTEDDFLSTDVASKLSPSVASPGESPNSTPGELSTFIDRFSNGVKETDPENSLITTLQTAKSIIHNFDGSKLSSLASDIKTVGAEQNQYLNATAGQPLGSEDKTPINQLEMALKIADKTEPRESIL